MPIKKNKIKKTLDDTEPVFLVQIKSPIADKKPDLNSQINCEGFYTEIEELDRLLGLNKTPGRSKFIRNGTIILIRGEPGAGKTTLALQILSNILEKHTKYFGIFFSLETDPFICKNHAHERYRQFNNDEQLRLMSRPEMEEFIQNSKSFIDLKLDDKGLISIPSSIGALNKIAEGKNVGALIELFRPLIDHEQSRELRNFAAKELERWLYEKISINNKTEKCVIIIDSLNVLISLLRRWFSSLPDRFLLNLFCDTFLSVFPKSIIIFTNEHHFDESQHDGVQGESFFCDIEIALFSEPIVIHHDFNSKHRSALGVNALSIAESSQKTVLTQSFCRILKSRMTPNQSRRCAYDIVPGKGIEFFSTYPGDGQVVLFAENNKQRELWENFNKQDLPHLYPALRYEVFDRSGLQRTSSAQRRFRYIPNRTDMYLVSLDNYWINWYFELCRKWTIVNVLNRYLSFDKFPNQDNLNKIVNKLNSSLSNGSELINKINKRHYNIRRNSAGIKLERIEKVFDDLLKQFPNNETNKSKSLSKCVRCMLGRRMVIDCISQIDTNRKIPALIKTIINNFENSPFNDPHISVKKDKKDFISYHLSKLIVMDPECFRRSYWEAKWNNNSRTKNVTFLEIENMFTINDKSVKCRWEEHVDSLKDVDKNLWSLVNQWLRSNAEGGLFNKKLIQDFFVICTEAGYSQKEAVSVLCSLFYTIVDGEEPQYSMLFPIPVDKIRLFGERKSPVIWELESHQLAECRPIHRPNQLFHLKNRGFYTSVPYDANVSFLVIRNDIVQIFAKELKSNPDLQDAFAKKILEIATNKEEVLSEILKGSKPLISREEYSSAAHDLVKKYLIEKDSTCENLFKTWEEVLAFLYLMENHESLKKDSRPLKKYQYLIESRTFDSMLCVFLEFIWSCDGNLQISPEYTIENQDETIICVLEAFYYLAFFFNNKWTPSSSTLEPEEFGKIYSKSDALNMPCDWVFARHWYSTFIDVLSARKPKGTATISDNTSEFLWDQNNAELEIHPIPVSFKNYIQNNKTPKHYSCWGDWHFALINGSENTNLGVDLINNLMNSERVRERSLVNAALPTLEGFYEMFGNDRCFNLPEREKEIKLPLTTYKEIREYFAMARSRSNIFDYHHCMNEFHPILEYIRTVSFFEKDKSTIKPQMVEINKMLNKAITNIKGFINKPFLMA